MSDAMLELLDRIKQGDESAFAELAEEYSSMTESAVRRFAPSFGMAGHNSDCVVGEDDLRQCAYMALFRAASSYRPDAEGKSVSFGLYSKICVNNALISELRKYKSEQRRRDRLKESSVRSGKKTSDPLSRIVSSENASELLSLIDLNLSVFEKEVFDNYIVGKSVGEIAERLGKDEKSVSNALYRMKVKIKGLLKNQ